MIDRSSRASMTALAVAAVMAMPAAVLAQSARSADAAPPPVAPTAAPMSAPTTAPMSATQPAKAAPDMQTVLDQLAALGGKPIETLTPAVARMQPSAADAAKQVMIKHGLAGTPDATVTTRDVPYGSDAQHLQAGIARQCQEPARHRLLSRWWLGDRDGRHL